jgi:copper chaperone CopZ
MKIIKFHISGMTCMYCVNRVTKNFKNHKGVKKAEVTLNPPEAVITCKKNVVAQELADHLSENTHYEAKLK